MMHVDRFGRQLNPCPACLGSDQAVTQAPHTAPLRASREEEGSKLRSMQQWGQQDSLDAAPLKRACRLAGRRVADGRPEGRQSK